MTAYIGALCTWAVGTVLIASGSLKRGTAEAFRQSMIQLQLPRWTWTDRWFARVFPWFELALGMGAVLLPGPWQEIAAVGVLALFTVFLIVVVQANRRPVPVSCNCFGGLGNDTVSFRTIVRNAVLVALALSAVGLHRSPATVAAERFADWCYPVPAVLAVVVAAALICWRGVVQRRRQTRLVRTLSVKDIHGNELPITEFQDPPTFLVFFFPGCGGCQSTVEHFRWWPHLLCEGWDLQPVFLGAPEQFTSQETYVPLAAHAWYADDVLARHLGVSATPCAVAIDPDHPLGHLVTSGRQHIQDLVLRDGWQDEVRSAVRADDPKR